MARKAEGEHKQEKHDNSCASKSGIVSEVPSIQEGNTNPDSKAPTHEPRSKWVEMQQQLMVAVKEAQSAPKKTPTTGIQLGSEKKQSRYPYQQPEIPMAE